MISCNCFGNDYIFVVFVCECFLVDVGLVYCMIKYWMIFFSKVNFIVKNGFREFNWIESGKIIWVIGVKKFVYVVFFIMIVK